MVVEIDMGHYVNVAHIVAIDLSRRQVLLFHQNGIEPKRCVAGFSVKGMRYLGKHIWVYPREVLRICADYSRTYIVFHRDPEYRFWIDRNAHEIAKALNHVS